VAVIRCADKYRADGDLIYGGKGFDLIYMNDGDTHDRIRGGAGKDRCYMDVACGQLSASCSWLIAGG
jgi:hypothetical protein